MQHHTIFSWIKKFFTKKRIIWGAVGLFALFLIWMFFIRKPANDAIQTAKVVRQDIEKTVLTTGQVVSSTDLSLSFQTSGFVRRINVKEGDEVRGGQVLAVLDQGNAVANLESAKASLTVAQANYDKMKLGATAEDVAVTEASVNSYQTTLANAKQNLLNQLSTAYNDANTAVLSYTNILFSNPQNSPQLSIPGTVQTNQQAVANANTDRASVNQTLTLWQTEVLGLNESNIDQVVSDSLKNLTQISQYLGNLLIILTTHTQITAGGSQTTVSGYATGVATAKASVDGLATTIISYVQTVKTAQANLASAQASLALKKTAARPEDVNIAYAQVLSAQGGVHSAEVTLNNTLIIAPTGGTVTQVNIKLGELATASKEVIKLLNIGELHTEAQVSEADIASITVGQKIDNTFDALGPDRHFESKVLTVNPASTVVSGVVNYKVTGSLENIPGVKPGMTANMTILVEAKADVLTVPSSAVINRDNKKFVRIVDDPKTKTYHEVEVQTSLQADGGIIEVASGLVEGQEIVTYIK